MKSKLIQCKTCGSEIAKSAKTCPNCGAKNKKPIFKRWWFWAIIIIIILVVAGSQYGTSFSGKGSKKYESLSKEEYMAQCQPVSYEEVARNPNEYKGKLITFHGKVIESKDGSPVILRINQDNPDDRYSSDTWFVTYDAPEGSSRILVDDEVMVFGESTGVTSYTAVLGQKITLPSMVLMYLEYYDS